VVDLERLDLAPLDPALAVHEGDVVVKARAQDRAHDLGRPRTIALHADHDLVLGGRWRGGPERPRHAGEEGQYTDEDLSHEEFSFSSVRAGQYANGQMRK
jgi:hypothetical protein